MIRIVNWERHQHHQTGDRAYKPPWIKLYRDLLDCYEYEQLSEADRSLLIGLWMMAAKTGNMTPMDLGWLTRKLSLPKKLTNERLERLQTLGFIEVTQDASALLTGADSKVLPLVDKIREDKTITRERAKESGEWFEKVWALSKKGSKKMARQKWDVLVAGKQEYEAIYRSRKAHVDHASEPQYVTQLVTWINQERWDEEITPPTSKSQNSKPWEMA